MSALSFPGKSACRYILTVILIHLINYSLYSQNLTDSQKDRENIFIARIKQFNEFVDRFNHKSDFKGNPADSAFKVKMPRERMIPLLFDLKDPRLQASGKEYSDIYVKLKEVFTEHVVRNNIFLDKYSPGIIAEASARVIYNGEPRKIRLFLVQEVSGDNSVKWVLNDAKGDILNIFKTDTSMVRFIAPSSNETDFINLRRALEDTDHLNYYASRDYDPDLLTLFFYFIKAGIIKYEYVEEVIYHIIDIPGWYLKVKEFNRNELNSGWLITDIARNEYGLTDFIKNLK
jgi:hypothetical protein